MSAREGKLRAGEPWSDWDVQCGPWRSGRDLRGESVGKGRLEACPTGSWAGVSTMASRTTQPMQALSTWGVVTLAMTLLGWSSIPLFLRDFAGDMDAWSANGWRYGFSALLWLPLIVWGWRRGTLPAGIWKAALVPAAVNIVGQCTFAWAPYFIGPGLMTFGLRTQIIFVALGAYALFPNERGVLRSPAFIGALVVVFVGAVGTLLLAHEPKGGPEVFPLVFGVEVTHAQATAIGIGLSVGAGALFAGYALAVRHYMQGMPPVTAFAAICQYTGVGLVVIMLVAAPDRGAHVAELPTHRLWMLALSAVIGIALGHVFYYISIAKLGVAVSSGVIQLQPIIVAIGSLFLFGEVLTPGQWACGLAAVGAAMVMLMVQHKVGVAARRKEEGIGEVVAGLIEPDGEAMEDELPAPVAARPG